MVYTEQIRTVEMIQGSSGLAIREALSILETHMTDLSRYDIEVLQDPRSSVVLFFGKSGMKQKFEHIGARLEPPSVLSSTEIGHLMVAADSIRVLDRLDGGNFIAILMGMAEFEKHSVNLNKYKIELMKEGKFDFVVFSDKNQLEGVKGSIGELGFEVQIETDDVTVVRSNFVR